MQYGQMKRIDVNITLKNYENYFGEIEVGWLLIWMIDFWIRSGKNFSSENHSALNISNLIYIDWEAS